MTALRSYKDLDCWRRAMDLVAQVYELSGSWPAAERFGLTSQVRRAAISVPANIAEGAGRRTTGEFLQFLGIARGSLAELETLLLIGARLHYLDAQSVETALDHLADVRKMIARLITALKARAARPATP